MTTAIGTLLVVALLLGALIPASLHATADPASRPPPSTPHLATGAPTLYPSASSYRPVVIPAGNTTWWNGTGAGSTRLQQGSVTVESGGTLIVQNVTLSMVQFVGTSGTLTERLSNVSRFVDAGSVVLRNATLTTDASVSYAYLKLNLTVTGSLSLWHSALEFPGWLNVADSASVTLNASLVAANPDVNSTGLDQTIQADTSYAPSINITNGGQLVLLDSRIEDTYSDNSSANGLPGPLALTDNQSFTVTPTSNKEIDSFQTPTDAQSLIQDWLYPMEYPIVALVIDYTISSGSVTSNVNVTFNGTTEVVGSVTFSAGTSGVIRVVLPSLLLAAINRAGPAGFLMSTGSFDHNTPYLSVGFNATAIGNSSATITRTMIVASPALSFNVVCSGARSAITAIDSVMNLTWNRVPSSPESATSPYAWDSNKLVAENNALILLANISIPSQLPQANITSAVQADPSSVVFTYRWAEFGADGPGGLIPDARVTAFSSAQGEVNTTANSLNDLRHASPTLWEYVQWWDGQNGLPGYGLTGATGPYSGQAFLLLAASNLTNTDAGIVSFIGGYNVGVSPPLSGVAPQWSLFNVTPYPQGLVNATPDRGPTAFFLQYSAILEVLALSLTADGVATIGQVRIGQLLGVEVRLENVGATPVFNVSGLVEYVPPGSVPPVNVSAVPVTPRVVDPGGATDVNFTWRVNESTVGAHGTIPAGVSVSINWNGGPALSDGGTVNTNGSLRILPSSIVILDLAPPPHNLSSTTSYTSAGAVTFNGSGLATINLTATPVNGGTPILLATNLSLSGSFALTYSNLGEVLQPGVAYVLEAVASYNTANSTPYVFPGNYSVSAPTPAAQGYTVPWWIWVVVAGAAVAALGVFLVRRRRPAPQVECGECSALVPAGSESCPTCGIYFETAESRCARCGGPIPAGVLACPECRYQPSDRPGPPGPVEDREAYRQHAEEFRAAAQGELGEDYPEVDFWKWWRHQPSYQSFRDWKTGQEPAQPTATDGEDSGLEGIGGGR